MCPLCALLDTSVVCLRTLPSLQDPHRLMDLFLDLNKRLKAALDSLPASLRPIAAVVLDESDEEGGTSVSLKACHGR